MSEKKKEILEVFRKLIPNLSEADKSYLLGLGEGMAIAKETKDKKKQLQEV